MGRQRKREEILIFKSEQNSMVYLPDYNGSFTAELLNRSFEYKTKITICFQWYIFFSI